MGENYEADYYKSVTDDLRVANERLNETITTVRHRAATADQLICELLKCLEDGNPIEDVVIRMHHHVAP
ncbi:MAG: hypothetical protein EBX67_07565 [Betaproteobacteria bacterium]|nr:hypothetical protein [Betaproteobacteria bacterium]